MVIGVSRTHKKLKQNVKITDKISHLHLKNDHNSIEQVTWNKSSLLLKSILQNLHTLQLLTMIIKTESTYKSY